MFSSILVRNRPATKLVMLKVYNVKLSFDIQLVLYILYTILLTATFIDVFYFKGIFFILREYSSIVLLFKNTIFLFLEIKVTSFFSLTTLRVVVGSLLELNKEFLMYCYPIYTIDIWSVLTINNSTLIFIYCL